MVCFDSWNPEKYITLGDENRHFCILVQVKFQFFTVKRPKFGKIIFKKVIITTVIKFNRCRFSFITSQMDKRLSKRDAGEKDIKRGGPGVSGTSGRGQRNLPKTYLKYSKLGILEVASSSCHVLRIKIYRKKWTDLWKEPRSKRF